MKAPELEAYINLHRGGATLRLFTDCAPPDVDIKEQWNRVIEQTGFERCERLHEIDPTQAETILVSFLHRNMAYKSVRHFTLQQATDLARQFLGTFPAETRYFTNSNFHEWIEPDQGRTLLEMSSGWIVAPATFETGVIAISPGVQGILWFEDED